MKDKLIAISILFLLTLIIVPTGIAEESNSFNQEIAESFLKLKSSVDVSWDETELSEPIIPMSSAKTFGLNITYQTEYSYQISSFFANLMTNRQIDIKLEIIESPGWCETTLDKNSVSTTVSTEKQNLSARDVTSHMTLKTGFRY